MRAKKISKILVIASIIVLIALCRNWFIKNHSANSDAEIPATNEENNISDYSNITKEINTPGALKVENIFYKDDQYSEIKSANIIKLTNEERQSNGGLGELAENIKLDQSAKEKVEDMFKKQYFEHISPTKVGVGDLAQENGYEYITIGENLVLGNFENEKDLINAWMNSPGHRANILNNKYSEIGVYAKKGMFKGKEVWLAVQHFGLSLSICPQIDENLKTKIDIDQKEADELSTKLEDLKTGLEEDSMMMYVYGSKKQQAVEEYNKLAEEYNNLVKKIKSEIDEYNRQVQLLNNCIREKLS